MEETQLRRKIVEAAKNTGLVKTFDCCGVEEKFCNSDEWKGNLEGFVKEIRKCSLLKNGTLVSFSSGGSPYTGFIVGKCSYDNAGEDNGYVIRYVWLPDGDAPRKPYTISGLKVEPLTEYPEDFYVGGHWSATPDDRCKEWKLQKDEETGHLLVVPL